MEAEQSKKEELPPVAMFKSTLRQIDIVDRSKAPLWKKMFGYLVIFAPYFLLLIAANEIPRLVLWLMGLSS